VTRSLGAFDPSNRPAAEHEGLRLTPSEGWTTFLALLVMLLAAAFAVDDAAWAGYVAGTGERQTAFLPMAVLLAAVVGLVLAKSRLSTFKAHLVGASLGAAYVLYGVAGAISSSPSVQQRLRDLNESVATFLTEVVGLGIRSAETSVFLLILGAIIWSAGQFAAFVVFRRRRALPAIAVATTILLVNMAITIQNQYLHLVLLAIAALWLLVRLNLLQQMESWRARRIGDGGYVSELFLRSGAVFVVLAIVGSLTLAANASSAPLQRAWRDMDDELLAAAFEINRWVGGVSGPARGPSNLLGPNQIIRDYWEASSEPVFTATTSDGQGHYWRGTTYDMFDGRGWQWADTRSYAVVAAGEPMLATTYEPLDAAAGDRREVVAAITATGLGADYLVAPESPYAVLDRPVELITREVGGNFAAVRAADGLDGDATYTVASLVRKGRGEQGALTAGQLAAAGVEYPAWAAAYTEIREGSIGRRVYTETERIVSRLSPARRNPYHIAEAIQNYLYRDGGFAYDTDSRGVCAGESLIDCFLRVRQGHCEWFATAMVMMLRTQQIPARYVVGYLPGKPVEGGWSVDRSAGHAWVEVYFPTHGWVRFDPTPGNEGNGQEPTRLDLGAPVRTPTSQGPTRTPSFEAPFDLDPADERTREGLGPVVPPGGGGPDLPLMLALAGLGLGLVVLLVVVALRRLPNVGPELAYRGLTSIATRFGHGPRPTQTAYEFADGLGELVPAVRSDLAVVATAKVESAYGRRQPEGEALRLLRQAYARARLGLLRLLVRRPSLPRRPRGT
jgi:transglutaminase-like putative cysteine protease